MPNHVHVLMKQLEGFPLGEIVKSWKVFTAREANAILGRTGQFWMREYHDRRIRDEKHMNRAIMYIRNNPVKAGLCERPEGLAVVVGVMGAPGLAARGETHAAQFSRWGLLPHAPCQPGPTGRTGPPRPR